MPNDRRCKPAARAAGLALLSCCALAGPAANADKLPLAVGIGDDVTLTPQLQYRPRFEAHNGRDFKPGDNYDAYSHRARLSLRADALGWIAAFVQVQDVRLFGEEKNTLGDFSANGLDVHQAWAELRYKDLLRLRGGRQELSLDGQRLIGAVGWTQQARSFDGALLELTKGQLTARAFWARLRDGDVENATTTTDLALIWARYEGLSWLRPSAYAIYDGDFATDRDRATLGLLVDGQPLSGLIYTAEMYYQLGKRGSDSISAWLASARVGYEAPVFLAPGVAVWFDAVSGDGDLDDDVDGAFDTLFATNHKFYGFMDYFLNIPLNTARRGLLDAGVRLQAKPAAGLLVFADYHHFTFARPFADGAQDVSWIGDELDLNTTWKVNRYLGFGAGFSTFFPQRGMTCVRGGCRDGAPVEYWGYGQTVITI